MAGETNQVLDDLELNLDIETITLDDIEINELDEETESENINIDNEDLNNIKLSEVSIDGNNLEIEGPGMEPVISEPEPPVQPADDEFQDENVAIPGEENIGAMETLNIIGNTPEPEIENHEEAMSQEEKERIEQEEKLAFKESTALEDAYTFENDDEIVSIDGSDLDRIIYGDSSNEYSPDENFQLNIDDTEEIDNDISDVELISEPTDVFISEEDADRPKSESQDTIPELDFDLSVIPDVVEVDDDDSPIALSMEELNNIEVYEKVDEDAAEVSSEEGVDFGIPDEETVSFEDEPIVDEVEPPAETIDISFEDDFIPSQDEISDEMQAIQLEPVIDEEPLEVSAGETPDFGIPDEETVSFEDEPVVDEVEPPAETVDISFEDDFIPSQDEISDEMQAIQLEPVIDEEPLEVSAGETPDFGIPDEETVSFEDEPVVDEVEPPAETVDISFEDDFIPSQDEISDEMQAIQLEPVIDEEPLEVSAGETPDFGIPDEETVSFEDEPVVDEVEPPAETVDISFEDDFIPSQDEISDEMQAIQLEPVIDEETMEAPEDLISEEVEIVEVHDEMIDLPQEPTIISEPLHSSVTHAETPELVEKGALHEEKSQTELTDHAMMEEEIEISETNFEEIAKLEEFEESEGIQETEFESINIKEPSMESALIEPQAEEEIPSFEEPDLAIGETEEIETGISTEVEVYEEEFVPPPVEDVVAIDESELQPEFPDTEFDEAQFEEVVQEEDHVEIAVDELNEIQTGLSNETVAPEMYGLEEPETQIEKEISLPKFEEPEPLSVEQKEQVIESKVDSLSDETKTEIKKVLKYLDNLLDDLPEEKIKAFSQSEYYDLYIKIMDKLGV